MRLNGRASLGVYSLWSYIASVLILLHTYVNPSLARLNDASQLKVGSEPISSSTAEPLSQSSLASSSSSSLSLSHNIPPLQDSIELVRLSSLVYDFEPKKAQNCSSFPTIYDEFLEKEKQDPSSAFSYSKFTSGIGGDGIGTNFTFQCHMFERDDQDTQVLVLSRTTSSPKTKADEDYIAVVYAGTDDFRNALTDTDIFTTHFGPSDEDYEDGQGGTTSNRTYNFPPLSDKIRVHKGFNNAVFKHGLFDRIFDTVKKFKEQNPNSRILTTGHSLGASDSVLTAVALKLQPEFKDNVIHSINFGCPKTGNHRWRTFVDGMQGLGIWRVVNGLDLIPRLPGARFHHVGHTVQLDSKSAKGYWMHEGNKTLGYAGIPFGWNTLPYVLTPVAAYAHIISHYTKYFYDKSLNDPATYYIDGFETVKGGDQYYNDDDDNDDDIWNSDPPDDDLGNMHNMEFAKQYAEQYTIYAKQEREEGGYFLPIMEGSNMLNTVTKDH